MIGPDHYRYKDVLNEGGLHLVEEAFEVLKETPCGYWVKPLHGARTPASHVEAALKGWGVRFVLKDSERRHCYPDRSRALHSYVCRKDKQIQHSIRSLERSRHALEVAGRMLRTGLDLPRCRFDNTTINMGMPEAFQGYHWEY